ncbi:MAG: type II 3-dehydroquinate dehydratase [Longimicrobiales bacterium]
MRISVLHGPNLNLLGAREPEIYGRSTLAEIATSLEQLGADLGVELRNFQANGEGALIDRIHADAPEVAGFVINAGAYTHTSIALRDALVGVARPFVEVHLSNTLARESFRRRSLLAGVATGVVMGFGAESYRLAVRGLVHHLQRSA